MRNYRPLPHDFAIFKSLRGTGLEGGGGEKQINYTVCCISESSFAVI